MTTTTLASLAILKARFDVEGVDYLDTLCPFVHYVLGKESIQAFTPRCLQNLLLVRFGLQIPQHTVTLLAKRMAKRGIFQKDHKRFLVIKLDDKSVEFEQSLSEAVRHQNATVSGLADFAKNELNTSLSEGEALDALYNYIDQYSIECIKAYSSGSPVPKRGKEYKHWRYVVSRYVNFISRNNPNKFDYLLTVIKGRMLSNALMGSDLSSVKMQFKKTTVYLDTPIVLQLIGVLGEYARILSKELLDLLFNANARVAVFQHNLDEVNAILRTAETRLESGTNGFGDVIIALRELGKTPSDVALLRGDLQNLLKTHHVEIADTPAHIKELQIGENRLQEEMDNAGLYYHSDIAKQVDINSVRSVYALRGHNNPTRLEESLAVHVTTNSALARAAYSYSKNHEDFDNVSPVITDFSLTNLVWLKSPMSHVDLPQHLTAANSFAALRPSDSLWNAFMLEIDKLENEKRISPKQHQYLRYELRVRSDLMELTLGDESSLTEARILQVLDQHAREIAKPWKDKYEGIRQAHCEATEKLDKTSLSLTNVDKRIDDIGMGVGTIIKLILVGACIWILGFTEGWWGISEASIQTAYLRNWPFRIATYIVNGWVVIGIVFGARLWDPITWISQKSQAGIIVLLRMFFRLPQRTINSE